MDPTMSASPGSVSWSVLDGRHEIPDEPTVLYFPPAAPDECLACRVELGEGLTLVARARAPMDQYCIQCADWLDKAAPTGFEDY